MAQVKRSAISCGVYQLFGLHTANDATLKALMRAYKGQAVRQRRKNGFAQVIFSDADYCRNGERLAVYLQDRFPTGKLVKLTAFRSPSTGNNISTWIWNIPHPSFKKHPFYAKIPARRDWDDEARNYGFDEV